MHSISYQVKLLKWKQTKKLSLIHRKTLKLFVPIKVLFKPNSFNQHSKWRTNKHNLTLLFQKLNCRPKKDLKFSAKNTITCKSQQTQTNNQKLGVGGLKETIGLTQTPLQQSNTHLSIHSECSSKQVSSFKTNCWQVF